MTDIDIDEKQEKLFEIPQETIQVESDRISHRIRMRQMWTKNEISIL